MFSNLASYFFGSEDSNNQPPPTEINSNPLILSTSSSNPINPDHQTHPENDKAPKRQNSEEESDWVLVGPNNAPNLGSLNDAPPTPSIESEPEEQPNNNTLSRTARRLTAPFGCAHGSSSVAQIKALRSAQSAKKKDDKKVMGNAKGVERRNKAVKNPHHNGKRAKQHQNLSFKACGAGLKQLKQC